MDINTLDVTLSGYPAYEYRLPNGDWQYFHHSRFEYFWKPYKKPTTKTLNLINVESFESLSYPIVDISVKSKPVSWLKRFWYSGWNNSKLYSTSINVIGMKIVTKVTMRSKETYIIDESVQCLKNAIDACVWNIDSRLLP